VYSLHRDRLKALCDIVTMVIDSRTHGVQSLREERAVDGAGTHGDLIKTKARPLSESSLLFQIPPWSHCMHTEASVPAQGFHSGFYTNATLLHAWRWATSSPFHFSPRHTSISLSVGSACGSHPLIGQALEVLAPHS
jgi:hypothetical protein